MNPKSTTYYRYFPVSGRDKKWGLFATTVGESRIPPGASYPPAGHPKGYAFDWQHGRILEDFALIYISVGRGKFECRPTPSVSYTARLEAGCAFVLFPGIWHRYVPDSETGWHEHWVGFDGELARRWQKTGFLSVRQPVQKIHCEDAILAVHDGIIQAIRRNRPALQQIVAGATAYLVGLFYSAQKAPTATENKNGNVIESAIALIQRDFGHELDMKKLARTLGTGYSWFRAKFAQHTGLSPNQYLLETRILNARSLLAETDLSVKEIGIQTGFEDQHYFSRLFRQKLNVTPTAWRHQYRQETVTNGVRK